MKQNKIIKTYILNEQNDIINKSEWSYQEAHYILKIFDTFMPYYYKKRKTITHFIPSKMYKNINYNSVIYYLVTGKLKKGIHRIFYEKHGQRWYIYKMPQECYSILLVEDLYKKLCENFKIEPNFSHEVKTKNKVKEKISTKTNKEKVVNILVYSSIGFKCKNSSHKIEDVTIIVPIIKQNGDIITIDVQGGYCLKYNIYFISTYDFIKLKQFGRIACRIVEDVQYYKNNKYTRFKEKSIIAEYGYTVAQKYMLSDKARQEILKIIINDNVLSNYQICTHLEWLIKYNGNNDNMKYAVEKWERDIDFLQNYKKEDQLKYVAESIKRVKYKSDTDQTE